MRAPDRRPLLYVMGPSGAGKDTLLRHARQRFDGGDIVFAHRYITRDPVAGDENFIALTRGEFDARARSGLFAFHWQAHGVRYGIGVEIDVWRAAGAMVVVSGSRAHFQAALADDSSVIPILVTASADILASRLATRARETDAAITARLARAADATIDHPRLEIVDNSGSIDAARTRFVELLSRLTQTVPAL